MTVNDLLKQHPELHAAVSVLVNFAKTKCAGETLSRWDELRSFEIVAAPAVNMASTGSILTEAENIVGGSRQADYGDSNENLRRIASIATAMGIPIDGAGVAKVLMAVKLARHMHKPKRDNLVDLAGYAELLSRWEESR